LEEDNNIKTVDEEFQRIFFSDENPETLENIKDGSSE
jgi:hypothetical protein